MNNPFKNLNQTLLEVPVELKGKVMGDIATAKLLMELTNLFSLNVGSIIESIIDEEKSYKKI